MHKLFAINQAEFQVFLYLTVQIHLEQNHSCQTHSCPFVVLESFLLKQNLKYFLGKGSQNKSLAGTVSCHI